MTSTSNTPLSPSPDKLDLTSLRLTQDFTEAASISKVITTIPVKKPGKQDFVRTRADEDWRLQTCVLDMEDDRDTYIVAPTLP
ncbi:MAG: hypothetical protein A3K53_11160 [Deltaproteobacteria bacterium RIFOXYB2_FULL_66_7]|nr:MAG: hypothetical protein A3K53_11160 [Deltaproteobacteria bacterium RIFOXYB2_FULL_66_7]